MTFLHLQSSLRGPEHLGSGSAQQREFGDRFPHQQLFSSHREGAIVEVLVPLLSTFSFTSGIWECELCTSNSKGTVITSQDQWMHLNIIKNSFPSLLVLLLVLFNSTLQLGRYHWDSLSPGMTVWINEYTGFKIRVLLRSSSFLLSRFHTGQQKAEVS